MTYLHKIQGVPVVSAETPLTIQIEEQDVREAKPHSSDQCAAAVACRNHLKLIDVRVHMSRTYIRFSKGKWTRYRTSPKLKEQLVSFDRGEGFKPGTYTLYPGPASRSGLSFSWSSGRRKSRKKPYAFTQRVREIAGGLND
jgi:hypothetical protein